MSGGPGGTEEIHRDELSLAEHASVVIVTYNHADFIEECLETVLENNPEDVIVVDSGSTDGTVDTVENTFPEVHLVETQENLGYGAGNNRAVDRVDSEYIVVLNPDTRVGPNCLDELLKPIAENDRRITTPKILTYDGEAINTIGNIVHFSGLAFTRGYGDPSDAYPARERIAGVSGACFATTREIYEDIGGFEESIFIYMDDVELSWKANAAGLDILYVPSAIVFHDYHGVSVDPEKLFHLERGRYVILRKYLGLKGAVLVFPSLLMTEVLTWGYAVLRGPAGVKAKLRAIFDGFSTNVGKTRVDERKLLGRLNRRIPEDQLPFSSAVTLVMRTANKLYETNVALVNR